MTTVPHFWPGSAYCAPHLLDSIIYDNVANVIHISRSRQICLSHLQYKKNKFNGNVSCFIQ